MINLMLITNDPELARFAVEGGVQRIFVDLEINGKEARQGHLDTLISNHSFQDISLVRAAIPSSELLVRLNPFYEGSAAEVDEAIEAGADILMLPMFTKLEEVQEFVRLIDKRCRFIPLVETPQAVALVSELVVEPGVNELYVGLNDLHLSLGLEFMFQLVIDGTVERIANICHEHSLPFGFGGIARMDEGLLPGRLVLAEHCRLGSSAVILSRTFHRSATKLSEMHENLDFAREVSQLREAEVAMNLRGLEQILADYAALKDSVGRVLDVRRTNQK
ncbi:aldolase/citrate lyase family protein [Stutzerimonas nitrititolerans]|uniref:aldolase/citrate lyase family protein n=1 Tax=Stutzerimonas nitrititolerans TaxID=2482751 RepID=UPI0028AB9492|nr:aldolase/citrate lyase family protein [Stutzerimonas nitrititolerans]